MTVWKVNNWSIFQQPTSDINLQCFGNSFDGEICINFTLHFAGLSQPVDSWFLCFTYVLLESLFYIPPLQCRGCTLPPLIGSAGSHCEFVCRQNIWKMHKTVSFFVEIALDWGQIDFQRPTSESTHIFLEEKLKFPPEAVLPVVSGDVAAVHDGGEVVGAPLLPVSNALGLLSVGLRALDVHTGLVTQHQLGLVCNVRCAHSARQSVTDPCVICHFNV